MVSRDDVVHQRSTATTSTAWLSAGRSRGPFRGEAMLDIELDRDPGDCSLCRPIGELDASTVCQFRQILAELVSSPRLVIDMSGVVFIDSAGLGALIGGIRRAREGGGDVVLACRQPSLKR